MVLLDEEKPPLTRRKRIIRWILIVALTFGILMVLGLIILEQLGGKSESLRRGAEDYLSQQSGKQAEIGRFTYMGFYPDLRVDIGDIAFRDRETSDVVATIGSIQFSMRFWDMFFGRGQLETVNFENMDIGAIVHTPLPLRIHSLAIVEKGPQDKPALVSSGAYGGNDFSFYMELIRLPGSNGHAAFRRPKEGFFKMDLPFLRMEGQLESMSDGLKIVLASLGTPEKIFHGEVTLQRSGAQYMVQADLEGDQTHLKADLTRQDGKLTGAIVMPVLEVQDMPILRSLAGAVGKLLATGGDGTLRMSPEANAHLTVEVQKLLWHGRDIGSLSFPLVIEKGVARADELKGSIGNGTLSGSASLDGTAVPSTFVMKASLRDFQYGALQGALDGQDTATGSATAHVDLSSRAPSSGDIVKNLQGTAVIIAGQGAFVGTMLDVWNAGLIDIMLPGLRPAAETRLNCMIGSFTLDKGVARPETFFLDTDGLTVLGKGSIDFVDQSIDFKLVPQAKKATLIDMTTAVRIKGDLYHPSVKPDTLSLGTKLGAIVLGVVNPASLALTMTDLGLTDKHPCRAYLDASPSDKGVKEDKAP